MKKKTDPALLLAFLAAVFYALNVPFSKLLLDKIAPSMLAGLLYLGAGAGVGIMSLCRHPAERRLPPEEREKPLTREDLPYVVGMILLDIAAPVLLMYGIKLGTASSATLLGNFEIVATALIALLLFREKISGKLWIAILLITASGIILSFEGQDSLKLSIGSLLVILATLCWGLENNCTRSISGKSTYSIVTVKGLCSGTGSLIVGKILGESFPLTFYIIPALILGFVAYGLSIFTYVRAQRTLGAARTGACYAVAPFIGAFLSFVIHREPLTAGYFIALIIMIAGTVLVVLDTLKSE